MKNTRNKDLARIHIYKQKLGLSDEDYRVLLHGITNKDSAKDMEPKERWKVICEMRHLAGEKMARKAKKPYPGRPSRQSPEGGKERLICKIEAILADEKKPWEYVHSMAKHMFKIDMVQWCSPDQLWRLVAALEVNRRRNAKKAALAAGGE